MKSTSISNSSDLGLTYRCSRTVGYKMYGFPLENVDCSPLLSILTDPMVLLYMGNLR